MVHREDPSPTSPSCWRCATAVAPARLELEAVLRVRGSADGGPYRQWRCPCGTECGALRNAAGAWMLYPLEGFDDPDLLDRLVPRQSRETQAAAVEWWKRNAAHVERFRRGEQTRDRADRRDPRRPGRKGERGTPPPRGRASSAGPRSPPPRRPPARPAATRDAFDDRTPHEMLGIAGDATDDDIRRAYRKALKLCHPDRVAHLDADIQEVAHRKVKALRRAYETLLGPDPSSSA